MTEQEIFPIRIFRLSGNQKHLELSRRNFGLSLKVRLYSYVASVGFNPFEIFKYSDGVRRYRWNLKSEIKVNPKDYLFPNKGLGDYFFYHRMFYFYRIQFLGFHFSFYKLTGEVPANYGKAANKELLAQGVPYHGRSK